MRFRPEAHEKVGAVHLKRNAYLYVRQSTMHQVVENTESTERQYALRRRAVALGWTQEQVVVIDSDQGQSGASGADREGFQKLVTEVGMGRAGIVMGLEVSRLARNSADWHRLLEMSALTETLILDEDGVYDPAHFNDRLLLGLKGTMSEAELHILRARLRGGLLNKARRGELRTPIPVGFVYDANGKPQLDPDKQVQETIRHFFKVFAQTGSALGTAKEFRVQGVRFPKRISRGPRKGELVWNELTGYCAGSVLHNPRYAGAFFFGRNRSRKLPDGRRTTKRMPQDEWLVLIPEAHEGYISWEQFQENECRLRQNSVAFGNDRKKSPARDGPALLQGLAVCGKCGKRMTVRYKRVGGETVPIYVCVGRHPATGEPVCETLRGATVDAAVAELILETVTPLTLEVALTVQNELQARIAEVDRLRYQRVERLQYEADLARRQYMQVDPDNRLVADELESAWNNKLRDLRAAMEEYEKRKEEDRVLLGEEQTQRIRALAADFPRIWNDPGTVQRDRKRMLRLVVEDVTLRKDRQITASVRFKGGATTTLTLPRPLPSGIKYKTPPETVAEIDRLLDHHTRDRIADILNARGFRPGKCDSFNRTTIKNIENAYGLKSRYQRLRDAGKLTRTEMAQRLGVYWKTVKEWRQHGLLRAHLLNDKGEFLYDDPGDDAPVAVPGRKLSARRKIAEVTPNQLKEVQYDK